MEANTFAVVFLVTAAIFSVIEIGYRKKQKKGYDFTAFRSTLFIMLGYGISKALTVGIITSVLFAAYSFSPFKLAVTDWRTWLFGFFLVELAYYWQHRCSHTIRWVWASHAVHHSPTELVLPAAFRLSWTSFFSAAWLLFIPVALLGIHPIVIGSLLVINLRYQFFLHTEHVGKLGPLEWVFNTPANHSVHHSSQRQYLDKNFGGMLVIYDHLFGTYAAKDTKTKLRYGLGKPIGSNNPFAIVFHEWIRLFSDVKHADSLGNAMVVMFGRPGALQKPKPPPVKPLAK